MRVARTGRFIVLGAALCFLWFAVASASSRSLARERRTVGTLTDAAHGEPLKHKEFRFVRGVRDGVFPWQLGEGEARGTTDLEGRFEVDLEFAPMARHFSVEVDGYAPALFFADPDAMGTTTLDLSLNRPGELEVKMSDSESLEGQLQVTGEIQSLQIAGQISGPRPWATFERSLRLPSVGPILFEDIPPRAGLWLRWEPARGLPVDGPTGTGVPPGDTRVYDFPLPTQPVSLRGRVRDQFGKPRVGDEVVLFQHHKKRIPEEVTRWVHTASSYPREHLTAKTDELGVFSFENLLPGKYWIASFEPKLVPYFRCEIHRLVVPLGVTSHEVDLVFPRGLSLSGTVHSDGTRHRDENVRLRSIDPDLQVQLTATLEESSFYFGALPEGRYELRARPGDFDFEQVASEPVIVRAGASDIHLELRPEATVSGFVVGGAGPSSLVFDPPLNRTSPYCEEDEDRTNRDGVFEVGSLTPGSRRILARQAPNLIGISEAVDLEVGETKGGVAIELSPGATVRIEHKLRPQRATCQVRAGGVTWEEELSDKGEFTTVIVPAGRVVLRVEHASLDAPLYRAFEVVAGEERAVKFARDP